MRKMNNLQFTQIYSKEMLPKHFYEEFEYEEVLKKVTNRFERFLDNEIEGIEDVLLENFRFGAM